MMLGPHATPSLLLPCLQVFHLLPANGSYVLTNDIFALNTM